LNIHREHIGHERPLLKHTNGAVVGARKCTNHRTLFSHHQLTIEQYAGASAYGYVVNQDVREYHVHDISTSFGGHMVTLEIVGKTKGFTASG
jgi:hypothetical protein